MDLLVSPEWLAREMSLADEMGASDLRIVDASYFLPEAGRDAAAEFDSAHLPGALYLNLTELVDSDSPLPNMLPPTEKFASRMTALGIGDGSRIVFYDDSPHHTSARAWWMFRLFGVDRVAILDGGLARWKAQGRPLESGPASTRERPFTVARDDTSFRSKEQVAEAIAANSADIVDARSLSRFTGEEQETRPGLASGHMPGARSLPYSRFFESDGTWKRGDALRALFTEAGVDLDRPMIATCGSGITAAVLSFGAALLGKTDVALYDGSWTEWGSDPALPKATGAA